MHISAGGLSLVKAFESCLKSTAGGFKGYYCPANKLTIGWGHTNDHGRQFNAGSVWTQAECDAELATDMEHFEAVVGRLITAPLSQFQYDALVSFSYNCGEGALEGSTLRRKVNSNDYEGASREFQKWVKGHDKTGQLVTFPGLVRRRASESLLFQGITDADYDGKPDAIQSAREAPISRVEAEDDVPTMPQQVEPPAPTPEAKPLVQSKTMWGNCLTTMSGLVTAGIAFLKGLPPEAWIALSVLICVGGFLVFKGRFDVQKTVKQLAGG